MRRCPAHKQQRRDESAARAAATAASVSAERGASGGCSVPCLATSMVMRVPDIEKSRMLVHGMQNLSEAQPHAAIGRRCMQPSAAPRYAVSA